MNNVVKTERTHFCLENGAVQIKCINVTGVNTRVSTIRILRTRFDRQYVAKSSAVIKSDEVCQAFIYQWSVYRWVSNLRKCSVMQCIRYYLCFEIDHLGKSFVIVGPAIFIPHLHTQFGRSIQESHTVCWCMISIKYRYRWQISVMFSYGLVHSLQTYVPLWQVYLIVFTCYSIN